MRAAYKRVVANKGSHGVDGMEVDELLPYLKENWPTIKQQLLEGKYKTTTSAKSRNSQTRWRSKTTRNTYSTRQTNTTSNSPILNKVYNHTFLIAVMDSDQDAVQRRNKAAEAYINEGYTWVVDMDLESSLTE
ncbi:RNA-directed DNA polymerase (reverse transcriptase) [Thermoanaerobacter ethanolicus JW 200]|nr:RNA-directed DNA polymerase (reverse transcriptase) [Thermoanaerobacter ethanolicus JW 200]